MPTKESGTASAGIMVARMLRKKSRMTAITMTTARTSSIWTSATVALMVAVLSVMVCILTEAGKDACRVAMRLLMASATAMTFAPGWRCMERMMEGFISCLDPSSAACTV